MQYKLGAVGALLRAGGPAVFRETFWLISRSEQQGPVSRKAFPFSNITPWWCKRKRKLFGDQGISSIGTLKEVTEKKKTLGKFIDMNSNIRNRVRVKIRGKWWWWWWWWWRGGGGAGGGVGEVLVEGVVVVVMKIEEVV